MFPKNVSDSTVTSKGHVPDMASTKSLIALGLTDTAAHFSRRAWGRFSGSKLKLDWSMFKEDINCLKQNIPIHVYHFIFQNKSNKILSNCDKEFLNFTYTSSAFLSSIFPHTLLMSLAFSSLKSKFRKFKNNWYIHVLFPPIFVQISSMNFTCKVKKPHEPPLGPVSEINLDQKHLGHLG